MTERSGAHCYAAGVRVGIRSSQTGLILSLVATAVFLIAVGVFLFVTLRPKGELVGQAAVGGEALAVVAGAGDTLHFRLDYKVRPPERFGGQDRERATNGALRRSLLTIVVQDEAGASQRVACAAYEGKATTSSTVLGTLQRNGAHVSCEVPVPHAGTFAVRGTIAWDPDLEPVWARLEVRRAQPER